MRLILDTHAYFWWRADPARLSPASASAIRDPPAPKNLESRPVSSGCGSWLGLAPFSTQAPRNDLTSSAASVSPLGSPAITMNVLGFTWTRPKTPPEQACFSAPAFRPLAPQGMPWLIMLVTCWKP